MEESIVRKRLVQAAVLASNPIVNGEQFTMKVEVDGIHITCIFRVKSRSYHTLEKIISWEEIEQAVNNPLTISMTNLLRAARAFNP